MTIEIGCIVIFMIVLLVSMVIHSIESIKELPEIKSESIFLKNENRFWNRLKDIFWKIGDCIWMMQAIHLNSEEFDYRIRRLYLISTARNISSRQARQFVNAKEEELENIFEAYDIKKILSESRNSKVEQEIIDKIREI